MQKISKSPKRRTQQQRQGDEEANKINLALLPPSKYKLTSFHNNDDRREPPLRGSISPFHFVYAKTIKSFWGLTVFDEMKQHQMKMTGTTFVQFWPNCWMQKQCERINAHKS